ncbi:hypothetical protein J4219_08625 [Candidatus Woesearchaeota archaeon]|nr:hypothetical protein [Candidatus Woesearchaeota archaeon]
MRRRFLLVFLLFCALTALFLVLNYTQYVSIKERVQTIEQAEIPLDRAVQKIIHYHALFTDHTRDSLNDALSARWEDALQNEQSYETHLKEFQDLLLLKIPELIAKSTRDSKEKERTNQYLNQIIKNSNSLVNLERFAYEQIKQHRPQAGHDVIFGEQYRDYKNQLSFAIQNWLELESEMTVDMQNSISRDLKTLALLNTGWFTLVILAGFLFLTMTEKLTKSIGKIHDATR